MATELQEFLITLKEKTNIIDVAGNYLTLERRGGSYWACCPFHHEKTPSFAINEADQYYHCFGCGESGDVIKFVRELENIDFMEAVKLLADRAKLTLPQSGFDSKKTVEMKRKRDAVLKILSETAHFYLDNLGSGKAGAHVEYIRKRNIPANIVRSFGLGASLNFYDLPAYLLSKGYSRQDIIDSGVVNEVNGKLSDSQGGRLIYPIINAMDEVVAFGGRVLEKTDFAKYKNTRETIVFNKSKSLYNINLLKKLRKTQTIKEVIMVEGYMDTISLYQAGFKNVVASMGTSLTQEQARLLKRYTDNVLISYDGDGAGRKANMRGLEVLKSEGLNVKVVPLPDGLDPDDVIKQRGAEGYRRCLEAALPLIDYKLTAAKSPYDLNKTEDKRKYVADAIKIIKTADSAAEQEDLLKSLRDLTGITYESLKRDLSSAPAENSVKAETAVRSKDLSSANDRASRFVIAAYLFEAPFTELYEITEIPFENGVHEVIARYVISKKLLEEKIRRGEIFEFFEERTEEYEELARILDFGDGNAFNNPSSEKYFCDCVRKLKLNAINKQIDAVKTAIEKKTDIGERNLFAAKLRELLNLQKKLKSGDK